MKSFYATLVVLFLFSSTLFAQNFKSGTVTTTNLNTTEGRIAIDNSTKTVLIKKNKNTKTLLFNEISKVTWGNKDFSVITFNNQKFLAEQLVTGKASLFNVTENNFLVIKDSGEGKTFHLEKDKMQIPGILSVLFNDCNNFRNTISKVDEIDERKLKELVANYNNCDYEAYSPTEIELKNANTFNTDVFRISVGFITSFNKTSVNNFDSVNTTGFGMGVGVAASPSFLGKIQGNLYFDFDLSMVFTGAEDFYNYESLNYKVNAFRLALGAEYVFNKKGTIQPFLGIGYGYTSDYYNGENGTILFKDHKQNYFFVPKAGMLYKLKNGKHIGITVSYLNYENDLSYGILNSIPLVIDNDFITVGLNYYF